MAKTSKFVDRFSRGRKPPAGTPPQYPSEEEFLIDEDGDELPGITGQGISSQIHNIVAAQEQQEQQRAPKSTAKRTALHDIIAALWGQADIPDFMTARLAQYMDLDSAKETRNGFKINMHDGRTINWGLIQNGSEPAYEAITAPKRKFDQDAAEAVITLAALHGWNPVYLHGKQEHKEMLWLAVQRHNLATMEEFDRLQAAGKIPPDAECPQMVAANFSPSEDSPVYQNWLKEKAAWDAARAERKGATVGNDTPAATATETADAGKPDVRTEKAASKDAAAKEDAAPPKTAQNKNAQGETAAGDETKSKNPAFEAQHPRDEHGHFVNKETGKHAPIGTRQKGALKKEFGDKSKKTGMKKPAAQKADVQKSGTKKNGRAVAIRASTRRKP